MHRSKGGNCMTQNGNSENKLLTLAYDLFAFEDYGMVKPLRISVEPQYNSHMVIAGSSGTGKSYALLQLLARSIQIQPNGIFLFGDYKQDPAWKFLKGSKNYYPYVEVLKAIEQTYSMLEDRQQESSEIHSTPVVLVIDEYAAFIASLSDTMDAKHVKRVISQISRILELGRSLNIRIVLCSQTFYANTFTDGARMNVGIKILLGNSQTNQRMLMLSEHIEQIKGLTFSIGEGVCIINDAEVHCVKFPIIRDIYLIRHICREGLG